MLTVNIQWRKRELIRYPSSEKSLITSVKDTTTEGTDSAKSHDSKVDSSLDQRSRRGNDGRHGQITLAPGQILQGTQFKIRHPKVFVTDMVTSNPRLWRRSSEDSGRSQLCLPNVTLDAQAITRWTMAWRAIEMYESDNTEEFPYWMLNLARRCNDTPDYDEILGQVPLQLGFSAAAIVYGGLHALAWFAHFESFVEQLLWRISASVIMGGFPGFLFLTAFSYYLDNLFVPDLKRFPRILLIFVKIMTAPLSALAYPIAVAYPLARAYLVVECFVNLSSLPAGVYEVPSWSAYFPHIS